MKNVSNDYKAYAEYGGSVLSRVFCALPLRERIAIAHYILADEQVQQGLALSEVPNSVTLQAFAESKEDMPVFDTLDELVEDLLS